MHSPKKVVYLYSGISTEAVSLNVNQMQTTELKAKIEKVTKTLKEQFSNPTLRITDNVIKFNIKALEDAHVITLGVLSIEWGCDVQVKRSGAGLVVIIKL